MAVTTASVGVYLLLIHPPISSMPSTDEGSGSVCTHMGTKKLSRLSSVPRHLPWLLWEPWLLTKETN